MVDDQLTPSRFDGPLRLSVQVRAAVSGDRDELISCFEGMAAEARRIMGKNSAAIYALECHRAGARVTLIDRRNFHLFQPLLYLVATGVLSPANIASPALMTAISLSRATLRALSCRASFWRSQ